MNSNKPEFRARARTARDAITPSAQVAAALNLGVQLAALPEMAECVQNSGVIASYEATQSELSPQYFISKIEGRPKVVYPRVIDDRKLALHCCTREELAPGAFGIPEPDEAAHPTIDIADVDVVLVPGLAFDRRGGRIGYGKGYYDSLLTGVDALPRNERRPLLVGISYDETLFDELPIENHDIRMDIVVTPTQVIRVD